MNCALGLNPLVVFHQDSESAQSRLKRPCILPCKPDERPIHYGVNTLQNDGVVPRSVLSGWLASDPLLDFGRER